MSELIEKIHGHNIHDRYKVDRPLHLTGWNSLAPIFSVFIQEMRPKTIIEVGSWLGGSAINMAEICAEECLDDTRIICVDTWLGGQEHWEINEHREKLDMKYGYPRMYDQFMANIHIMGVQNFIVPLPMPSLAAARYLSNLGIKADLIYVDGSHDEHDVYWDLVHYFPLLRDSSSQMFGDDVHNEQVENGVMRFAEEQGLDCLNVEDVFWVLEEKEDEESGSDTN